MLEVTKLQLVDKAAAAPTWGERIASVAYKDDLKFPLLGNPSIHSCNELLSAWSTVSVVLATWNSWESLRHSLYSISKSSLHRLAPQRLQVVVSDDGSEDETPILTA